MADGGADLNLLTLMQRFAVPYPSHVKESIAMFIDNAEKLTLNDIQFHPPMWVIVIDVVNHCKTLVGNNVIQIKGFGKIHHEFEDQLRLFEEPAHIIDEMRLSPWNSVDAAFAGGCGYAASGAKAIRGLMKIMTSFKSIFCNKVSAFEQDCITDLPSDLNVLQNLELDFLSQEWEWVWSSIGGQNHEPMSF